MAKKKRQPTGSLLPVADYDGLLGEVVSLLETARRTSARTVNAVMTATYWEIGRRIVEVEQTGKGRANYGEQLLERLASDLSRRFGRGFSKQNLYQMRAFHLAYPILQTPSGKSSDRILQTPSGESNALIREMVPEKLPTSSAISLAGDNMVLAAVATVAAYFPLPWSHYVKLLAVRGENARQFYVI